MTFSAKFSDSDGLDDQGDFKQHTISETQALAMSDWLLDVDTRVMEAIKVAKERGFCSAGDAVIVVTGWVRKTKILFLTPSILFTFSVRVTAQQILYG